MRTQKTQIRVKGETQLFIKSISVLITVTVHVLNKLCIKVIYAVQYSVQYKYSTSRRKKNRKEISL